MSLAGRCIASGSPVPSSRLIRATSSKHDPKANTSDATEDDFPSVRTILLQFSVLGLALVLLYIRKSGVLILGYRMGLVWGRVPAECLLLSLLIVEMGARELTQLIAEIFGWAVDL